MKSLELEIERLEERIAPAGINEADGANNDNDGQNDDVDDGAQNDGNF